MSTNQVHVSLNPLSRLERIADTLMVPIMYVLAGTFKEAPQQTHRWNNKKLSRSNVQHLNTAHCVVNLGIPGEAIRWFGKVPRFHIPILGGWRKYLVLEPEVNGVWHVGWICHDVIGVTRIELVGPVRLLLGPKPVTFFGVDAEGYQIPLREIGSGIVGKGGLFSKVPLL